ncbi:hypothetical protein LTR37_017754 [Vermiconidia calcicola]|uniref:Uncharacterized protein n=1 Tax=Vermiconidia calcicola TaxID=1690605 RepID=A0ACC3MJ63_9PEZI|nr:hypothetical protein LTR37_017754 [Vermiconidia calcicola]
MPESDPPNDTWPSLILEFRGRLGFHDTREQPPVVVREELWREAVIKLCNRYRERDVQRLSARIRRQHAQIIDFTAAIDESYHFEESHALAPLIWQLLARAAAFLSKNKLADLTKVTGKLNGEVPSLNRELLTRFPYEPKVQNPLIELFREYMECYMILHIDRFEERIQNAREFFRQRTADWEAALKIAESEEQRRMLSATNPSSPNGALTGPLHSHGTNAHFRFVRELGVGTYGEVSMVMEATSGKFYAQKFVKVRNRHDARAKALVERQVKNEVDIMQRLRHHHIASVLFYVKDVSSFSLIMLPVGDYDLRHFLEAVCVQGEFPKEEMKHLDSWFGSLVSALAYAHEERIKHEDIKPSNVLIKDHRPYLADFGSAKDFSKLEASTSTDHLVAGTPVYWPPESKARGRPADIFALGCVFSEMLTVRQRSNLTDYRAARFVSDTDYGYAFRNNLEGVKDWLSNLDGVREKESIQILLLEVLFNMLEQDPDDRYTAKEIKRKFRGEEDVLFCPSC